MLQSSLTLNEIWQSQKFWEKMIEFSINDEINNSKEYAVFLNEDGKMREKRVESAIMSNLITFLFNMKLFGFPEDKSKIVKRAERINDFFITLPPELLLLFQVYRRGFCNKL